MQINFDNLVKISRTISEQHRRTKLRCCHVSFLLKRNRIVSIGVNADKTHPFNSKFDYNPRKTGKCAELDCVLRSKLDSFAGHSMVVIRINRENELAMSRPCIGCEHLIKSVGIENVWYTDVIGEFVKS